MYDCRVGGAVMVELLMNVGELLTTYVTLPIIALLLLTLIGVIMRDKKE